MCSRVASMCITTTIHLDDVKHFMCRPPEEGRPGVRVVVGLLRRRGGRSRSAAGPRGRAVAGMGQGAGARRHGAFGGSRGRGATALAGRRARDDGAVGHGFRRNPETIEEQQALEQVHERLRVARGGMPALFNTAYVMPAQTPEKAILSQARLELDST